MRPGFMAVNHQVTQDSFGETTGDVSPPLLRSNVLRFSRKHPNNL